MAEPKAHYVAGDIEARILAALRTAGLDPEQRLWPEALAALDHFHTGGLVASLELRELARIRAEDRVLDLGAGLAGPARTLAYTRGCRVDCLDLSADYCRAAALLNRLTGLDDRVAVHQGSALDAPFPAHTFDVVWMQNVGMNIADKRGLYGEVRRVLATGGRFAFQEVAAGATAATRYPLPWASVPAESFLLAPDTMLALLAEAGCVAECFEDTTQAHLSKPLVPPAPGQLSLAVFVDDLAQKAGNLRRSLEAGEVRLVRGVFRVE